MNFPEYKRARADAYLAYQDALSDASERLAKALIAADNAFLEDQDECVPEGYAEKRAAR